VIILAHWAPSNLPSTLYVVPSFIYFQRACGPAPPSRNIRCIGMRHPRPLILHCSESLSVPCKSTSPVNPFFFSKYSAVSIIRGSPRRWRIEGPAEVYFLNQLAWDLVQATGRSSDSGRKPVISPRSRCRWPHEYQVGSRCGTCAYFSVLAIFLIFFPATCSPYTQALSALLKVQFLEVMFQGDADAAHLGAVKQASDVGSALS
jgi:hypothetical protein